MSKCLKLFSDSIASIAFVLVALSVLAVPSQHSWADDGSRGAPPNPCLPITFQCQDDGYGNCTAKTDGVFCSPGDPLCHCRSISQFLCKCGL